MAKLSSLATLSPAGEKQQRESTLGRYYLEVNVSVVSLRSVGQCRAHMLLMSDLTVIGRYTYDSAAWQQRIEV